MKKMLTSFTILVLLAGCVTTQLVPEGYEGPTAMIRDSALTNSTSQTDFFYLNKVDGKKIEESRGASRSASYGQGFHLEVVVLDRLVPVGPAKFELIGRTEYAAPIQAMANKVYEVRGEVEFSPQNGQVYVVKGTLGEDYSAVWIEDSDTGEIMGQKVEVHGSAALNFFQK